MTQYTSESRIILQNIDLECGSPAATFLSDLRNSLFCDSQ
jgi:hypothetical protein